MSAVAGFKNMTTLGKVHDRVLDMAKNHHDEFVPVGDISFDGLKSVNIAGESFQMRTTAQREISNRLGVPYSYIRKCPEDVQAYNLNHWIEKEKNDKLFFRFDNDEVRAVFTPRYKPMDNVAVMDRLDNLGFKHDAKVQYSLDDSFMMLNIPDAGGEFTLVGKDKMRPGISIGNSEVGIASLSISAFILRLICTNGLISKTDMSSAYRHVSSTVLDKFPEVMAQLSGELVKQKQQLQFSLESRVDNPESTMLEFNRQFQLNQVERDAVEWGWIFEAGDTMFSVVNAYTKAAQYDGLAADSVHRLQRVGGSVLSMVRES
ncbi:DUF932 domain-containing protein [bacterium]|nr:DUF932 domain-containing protein [bacterium]